MTPANWKRPKKRGLRGLGDVVHALAQPVAGFIDTVAGTGLRNCAGCASRREAWNRRFPFPQAVDRKPRA